MKKEILTSNPSQIFTDEQLKLLERNLELSIDERINQLQSAVELIEEMRNSLRGMHEDRLQASFK